MTGPRLCLPLVCSGVIYVYVLRPYAPSPMAHLPPSPTLVAFQPGHYSEHMAHTCHRRHRDGVSPPTHSFSLAAPLCGTERKRSRRFRYVHVGVHIESRRLEGESMRRKLLKWCLLSSSPSPLLHASRPLSVPHWLPPPPPLPFLSRWLSRCRCAGVRPRKRRTLNGHN
ncbi:hypothetical protein IOCL1545_000108200 [Leishmania shawi]|uniref:Secreted protein n=1 Tax=Leishmania shawi TaxID=5680 RepID=A0ABR3EEL9_9TRYP